MHLKIERISRFVMGLVVIVLGALMLAEGILGLVTGQIAVLRARQSFVQICGFITILLGANLLD